MDKVLFLFSGPFLTPHDIRKEGIMCPIIKLSPANYLPCQSLLQVWERNLESRDRAEQGEDKSTNLEFWTRSSVSSDSAHHKVKPQSLASKNVFTELGPFISSIPHKLVQTTVTGSDWKMQLMRRICERKCKTGGTQM